MQLKFPEKAHELIITDISATKIIIKLILN